MLYPEGVRTVRWDSAGLVVVEEDRLLQSMLKNREIKAGLARLIENKLEPVDLEDWQEDNYNVMA